MLESLLSEMAPSGTMRVSLPIDLCDHSRHDLSYRAAPLSQKQCPVLQPFFQLLDLSLKTLNTKTFNCLLTKSRPKFFKKLADLLLPNYLTTLGPDRRPVSKFYLQPLRKISSCCFHFIQKISLQKETVDSTSDAGCLPVLLM